jgi:nicotinate-nucleotide adenylyltransferase
MIKKKKKIGILGGTFDPIHIGHLMLAQSAFEQLGLEKVLFIPSGMPPHKLNRKGGSSDEDRLEMTRLAIMDNPAFELSDIEMYSAEPTYTYFTVKKLSSLNPDNDYYFIIGEDSLVDFTGWRKPEEIVKYCHIVAGVRPGSSDEKIEEIISRTQAATGGNFIHIKSPALEISSHEIRQKIAEGRSVKYIVTDEVMDYIEKNGLYRE